MTYPKQFWVRGDKTYLSYEDFIADTPFRAKLITTHHIRCGIKNEWEGRTTPALPCLRAIGHDGPHRTSNRYNKRSSSS